MSTSKRVQLPKDIAGGPSQFQAWRAAHDCACYSPCQMTALVIPLPAARWDELCFSGITWICRRATTISPSWSLEGFWNMLATLHGPDKLNALNKTPKV
jgi:hypothetical protein